jgi:hypothetical protein
MNIRGMAAGYRLVHWAQVIRERTDRGQSIRVYCEERRNGRWNSSRASRDIFIRTVMMPTTRWEAGSRSLAAGHVL